MESFMSSLVLTPDSCQKLQESVNVVMTESLQNISCHTALNIRKHETS